MLDTNEVTAQTKINTLDSDFEYIYTARGCEYVFALQSDRDSAIVEAINRNGYTKWEAWIQVDTDWRVLDMVRDARESQR